MPSTTSTLQLQTFVMAVLRGFYGLALTAAAAIQYVQAAGPNYLITFGDSYSQTGFNVNSLRPSKSNPLGNPSFPGWTASGGPNWVGYLVSEYNASSLFSFNFASGGATVNASLVKPYDPAVKSLIDQVTQFSMSVGPHPSYAPWNANNTVFGIWMGVNDVGNSYWEPNVAGLHSKIMEDYFEQAEYMYNVGGRNFAFLSVPRK